VALVLSAQEAPPSHPRHFAYVLQAEALGKNREEAVVRLAGCGRDWIVLDPAYEAGSGGTWRAEELRSIRAGQPGRKVLAYLSVGEAEDYRGYWRREWDADRDGRPDAKAPAWLGSENPEWKGNYTVKYWQEAWQAIALLGVEDAMRQGFDGIYLDVVDAFESYEYDPKQKDWIDGRANSETGSTYRKDMHDWVSRIAAHARRQKAGALVIPQNGSQLLVHPEYVAAIDGIGVEDLFTDGDRAQPAKQVGYVLGYLSRLARAGKPVLVIEYGTKPKARRRSFDGARENGFALLVTDRELKTLGQSGAQQGE
jgi:cysteinyl-tRNA synthetase